MMGAPGHLQHPVGGGPPNFDEDPMNQMAGMAGPRYTTSYQVGSVQEAAEGSSSMVLPANLKVMTATLTKKETLDDKVERALSIVAEDMLDDVIDFACRLAKHRGSKSLHRNDVRLAFERRLKVRVPTKAPNSISGLLHNSAAITTTNSAAVTASANLPLTISTHRVSTTNYKGSLTLVKKAQDVNLHSSQA